MSIILSPYPKLQFISDNGVPMANCLLYTYQAGTNTPIATFADASGLNYNTNPVVLDAGGRANIWIDSNVAYKFVLFNKNSTILWTVDNINSSSNQELLIVNTIADLKAIDTTTLANSTVFVLGYYVPNDGGEGNFTFVSGSVTTADNGVVIQPTVGSGRWFRICDSEINILWYGAKGNGATDCSSQIQAANAYADAQSWNLFVPEGTFVINSNPELTVPVRFAVDGILKWSSFTMAIQPMLSADDFTQHFALSSTAACNFGTSLTDIYVDWFGAKGDGSFTSNIAGTDDTAAVQYAVNSATIGSWVVFNSAKKYWFGQITCKPGVHFKGTQPYENDADSTQPLEYLANLQYNGTGTSFFELSNTGTGGLRGISAKDLIIDGSAQATTIFNLQTTGSLIMSCTLRNATNGVVLTGSADSSSNRIIFCNLRNLTTAITTSGVGTMNGFISDNVFINNTTDLALDVNTSYTWTVHDNFMSNTPVIGVASHMYGVIDYQNAILGSTPVTNTTAPADSQILSSVGGWADNSTTFTPNETNGWNHKHLLRYSSSLDITGSRIHDSLGYDLSGKTPRVDTRSWYERDYQGNHHWGDLDKEFMMLDNEGRLSFTATGTSGRIPLLGINPDGPATILQANNYTFLNYTMFNATNILIMPEPYFEVGSLKGQAFGVNAEGQQQSNNVYAFYPCYSTTTPVSSKIDMTAASTIPYAQGLLSIINVPTLAVAQVGEFVVLTTATWAIFSSYPINGNNNNSAFMYGQVTAFDNILHTMSINIIFYSSHGNANLVTSTQGYHIFSAFPFLLKRSATVKSAAADFVGMYVGSSDSNGASWRTPDIGLIYDTSTPPIGVSPMTAQLSDMVPITEAP
jgi:hypothetical protein